MSIKFNQVSTKNLVESVKNNDSTIVDVRTVDAYNGWSLLGECLTSNPLGQI